MSAACRVVARGEVDAVLAEARRLGLLGWVRSEGEGLVRVHAEGADEAVAELRAFLGEPVEEVRAKVEGHEQFAVRGVPAGEFVVREDGGRFALTLEVAGGVRAWRLGKAPSMVPAERRFAVEHGGPSDAGAVWDRGPYEQGGRVPWPEAIERGHAVFVLHGEKLQGGFALQRTGAGKWLFVKRKDEFARDAGSPSG